MTSHSIQSFINAAREFPVLLEANLNCSEDNLKSTIEQVASVVSEIYSKFPLMEEGEVNALEKKGFKFYQIGKIRPPIQECERFKENLKQEIVTALNQKVRPCVYLRTGIVPEEKLSKVVKRSFSGLNHNHLLTFFPIKTLTAIYLTGSREELVIRMGFQAPCI